MDYDDFRAIPFEDVLFALRKMKYGTTMKVMFEMLALTGCRMASLNRMEITGLLDDKLYFKEAKTGDRRVIILPNWYIEEYFAFRRNNRVMHPRMFPISSETLTRYFNRNFRPQLNQKWNQKISHSRRGFLVFEFMYQLKGLRKNYATLDFKKNFDEWGNSQIALEFTAKHMKHSSMRMTAYHYLVNFEKLGIEKYKNMTMGEILRHDRQMRLIDFE